jgi:hypothetical protein
MELTEEEFVRQFEQATLGDFHHQDHVRIAWIYIREYPGLEALQRFCKNFLRCAKVSYLSFDNE